ncbi:hypothetical protein [Parapedobacter sp.]
MGALTVSFETAYSTFSKARYSNIFDTERSGIWTAEATVILPISKNLGMLSNVTFAQGMNPAYQFGVFIKPPRPLPD